MMYSSFCGAGLREENRIHAFMFLCVQLTDACDISCILLGEGIRVFLVCLCMCAADVLPFCVFLNKCGRLNNFMSSCTLIF